MFVTESTEQIYAQEVELLMKEVDRLASGRINQSIETQQYSGLIKEIALSVECLRKFIYSFVTEIQVTEAQVSSAEEQIMDTVGWADKLIEAFNELEIGAASIDDAMQNMSINMSKGEQSLLSTSQVFQGVALSTQSITGMVRETTGRLERLQEVMGGIDQIIMQIGKISNQIRLLSFNAAIEAARAGQYGRSFNVVAQEMKNLGDQSSQGVKDTAQFTGKVKSEINQVISTVINKEKDTNGILMEILADAENSFKELHTNMNLVFAENKRVQEDIQSYFHQAGKQIKLWNEAAESLRSTTFFLSSIGDSLKTSLSRLENNETDYDMDLARLEAVIEQLQRLAGLNEIIALEPGQHKIILSVFLQQTQQLEAIYSNRSDGTFIFSQPVAGLANARARLWWQEAAAGAVHKSQVYTSAITRRPCITVAVPIKGLNDNVVGVLGADLKI